MKNWICEKKWQYGFALLLINLLHGCTTLTQSMVEKYVEGQPTTDYGYLHQNPKIGDQAFYVNHESDESMPSPILHMEVVALEHEVVRLQSINRSPDSMGNSIFNAMMPDIKTFIDIDRVGNVKRAYLKVEDSDYHMVVTTPNAQGSVISREETYLVEPKMLQINGRDYLIDRVSVEHWKLIDQNVEFLTIRHLSPEVPFEIVQWTLTGQVEIDQSLEGTLITTLELANALNNPVSSWDTFNKIMALNKDHVRKEHIKLDWHYYPTLEAENAAVVRIHQQRNARKPLLQRIFE